MAISVHEGDKIMVAGTIVLNKPAKVVFDYIADLRNDHTWRTEIIRTEVADTMSLHTVATEHSYLSKKIPDHVYELRCTVYEPDNKVVFETTDANRFYLKSSRTLTATSPTATHISYQLEFDSKIVKAAIGFQLPKWLITYKANSDLKKYLKNLSRVV